MRVKRAEIREARKVLKLIKEECVHLNTKLTCIETFAYELTPTIICLVCGKMMTSVDMMSFEEKKKSLIDELGNLSDYNLSEEDIDKAARCGGLTFN